MAAGERLGLLLPQSERARARSRSGRRRKGAEGTPAVPPSELCTSQAAVRPDVPGKRSRAGRLRRQPVVLGEAVRGNPEGLGGGRADAGSPDWDTWTFRARRSQWDKLSAGRSAWWGLGSGNLLAWELPG